MTSKQILRSGLMIAAGIGLCLVSSKAAPNKVVRVLQTNSAGDNVNIIDPVTNKVVGEVTGIEVNHGVAVAPDGTKIYISDEANSTLDVADAKSYEITKKIPLSGHPNNITVTPNGKFVYVGIIQAPGGLDVIDTSSLTDIKTIKTKGTIHNPYASADGKYVIAGSIGAKVVNVVDTATNELAWTVQMDLGVRPMTMSYNPDGSVKYIFVQMSNFNGFAVIDFATHEEVKRIKNPDILPGKKEVPDGADPSHGMAVTPDGKFLLVNSRLNNMLYKYSLPDVTYVSGAELGGMGAGWLTVTPDGKTAYVSNPVTDNVSAIDIKSMKEIALIPVGYVPKRNTTGMLLQ